MTSVLLSGRVYDRQVGGNTRYVRSVYEGIGGYGVDFTVARPPFNNSRGPLRSVSYAAAESVAWPAVASKAALIHYPADTGAVVRGRLPIVATIHGLATVHVDGVRSARADALWRRRVKRLGEVADRIITVSDSSAGDIAHFIDGSADKIRVIKHGIDHEKFNTVGTAGDEEKLSDAGFPEQFFLYVGNLDPRKNITELTRAATIAFRKTGIPLVIIGAPAWESGEIMTQVRSALGVQYMGRLPDDVVVAAMRATVAFCFPSTYEGFGFPVIEAMACGAAVVTSDRGSLREVAGDSAYVLNEIDSTSIAVAMVEIAQDSSLRQKLTEAGLLNAQRFQWKQSQSAHAELFKEVAR